MTRRCTSCGTALTADARFCPACGSPAPQAPSPPSAAQTLLARLQRWGVPGFRSGTRWKQRAAAVGYALIILVLLGGIGAANGYVVALGLLTLVWVALVTNAWGLRRRVPVFGSHDRRVVVAGWVGLTVLSLIVLGAAGQEGETHRETPTPVQAAAGAPRTAETPTSPTAVVAPPATATVPSLAVPAQETATATTPSTPPRPTTPRPERTATPSPTPDARPTRLYELVVGAYRGTSKEFLVDGLAPGSFQFSGQRVTVQTDWYPDDEAKEWAVGFCNTVATFRSGFGYTEVQIKGQGGRTLARSQNRGRDNLGSPIIVCTKA